MLRDKSELLKCVNRRVGGLEITPGGHVCKIVVNRRVGGLEICAGREI